ncbi:MAG: phosphoribosylaminoimidazole-succinocarboxamide synthase [Rickettsiales bacterium]|jgi:phosphoribosylaminoimidazole-succinocarboxamide synthase
MKNKIYEGKAKTLYSTDNENEIIQYFKDDATAFNNVKKDIVADKGILNNFISEFIMIKMAESGIPTHFIKRLNEREQLVKKAQIIPLEIIIRNVTAGSMAKRLGIEEGIELDKAIFELCLKDDSLGDPLINDDHAVTVLKVIKESELNLVKEYTFKINQILKDLFDEVNIRLVDFKIEFGFDQNNQIILADEISPDSCRLWDKDSDEKMDKDRFRRDLGGLVEAYREIANRFGIKVTS